MSLFTASKLKKMKTCFREGDYKKAVLYADKLSPADIRTAYDLTMMADVYMENNRPAAAKRVYGEIFARNKSTRICKQLIDLSLQIENVKQAEKYLDELKNISTDDYEVYVYEYRIAKAKNEKDEVLLSCLEKIKEADYIDIWAFELAKLYFKLSMEEECRKECKNVILWFPETPYALKAKFLIEALDTGTTYEEIYQATEPSIKIDEPVSAESEEEELPVISFPEDDYSTIEYPEDADPVLEDTEAESLINTSEISEIMAEEEDSKADIFTETEDKPEEKAEESEVKAEEPEAKEPEKKAGKAEAKVKETEAKAEEKAEEAEAKAEEPEAKTEEPEAKAEEPEAEAETKAEEAEEPEEKAEEPEAETEEDDEASEETKKPHKKRKGKKKKKNKNGDRIVESNISDLEKKITAEGKRIAEEEKTTEKAVAFSEKEKEMCEKINPGALHPGPNTLMTNALADEVMKALNNQGMTKSGIDADDDQYLLKMISEDSD